MKILMCHLRLKALYYISGLGKTLSESSTQKNENWWDDEVVKGKSALNSRKKPTPTEENSGD